MRHLIFTFLLFFGFMALAQNQELFKKANDFYNQGKYAEAIDNYKAILESGEHSAELYFNLGNAHYKLNNIAPSIYYYEKALQLAPNDADIKNNLAFARNMTIDAIDIVPETGVFKFIKGATNIMSFDAWAKTAIGLVFCFVVLFLIYYFAYSTLRKRLTFIGSFVCLALVFISLAFAFHKYSLDEKNNPAIVFAKECQVKDTPNAQGEEVFRLHEGTKVQVEETYNNWEKITLSDGKTGWVASKDIRLLNSF